MSWQGNDKVFKGYVKGDGKSPTMKVKNKKLLNWDDVKNNKSFGAILNQDYIDISFDSKELSDMFWDMSIENNWKCLILENPSNGHIHSYWKNSNKRVSKGGKDKKLAVGLVADIHSGSTYIPLKVDGVNRFPPTFEPDEIDEVPDELLPVSTQINLLGLDEGDGRNDELFKYILILQSQLALDDDVIRRILNNTNKYIFESPLSDEELEIITRDEAFEAPIFYKGKSFLHHVFGEFLRNKYHIKLIHNQLHIYDDGIYVASHRLMEAKMIDVIPDIKSAQRNEVLKYLDAKCIKNEEPFNANYVAFRNGVLDIKTRSLNPFSPEYIITNKIPWDYNPNAYDESVDTVLNNIACNDESIRALLEECIGYCFYRRNELSKSFILTGTGSNGKSTFLDMVRNVLGRNNYVSLDIDELSEKFSTSTMFGKLANIGDDISDEFLQGKAIAQFKKIVSGNDIKGENKGQDVFFFKPVVKLLFSANEIPRVRNKGFDALKRRLVIIPFNAKFTSSDKNHDPEIITKLKTQNATEYLIKLGIDGLERVLKNHKFTESKAVEEEIKEFEKDNNPILQFIDDVGESEIIDKLTDDVFRRYTVFCFENGYNKVASRTFKRDIQKCLNCTIKDKFKHGKRCRVFTRE